MRACRFQSLAAVGGLAMLLALRVEAGETTSADRAMSTVVQPMQATKLGVDVKGPRGVDWVALPIPVSNPTVGTGLAATVMGLYRIRDASEPSITAVAAFGTDNESRGAGLFQQTFLGASRWEVSGALASAKLNLDFYGEGRTAEQDLSIAIEQRMEGGAVWALKRVSQNVSVGLRYRFDRIRVRPRRPQPSNEPPWLDVVDLNVDLNESTVEALFEYDTRDVRFWPTSGWYVEGSAAFTDEAIGSDITYQRHTASANWHRLLRPQLVLALRASACSASTSAPFFATCLFGQNSDVRGYVAGRYRGDAMAAAQAEVRWRVWKRFGAVAFAGSGDATDDFGDLRLEEHWSAGVGLRFVASPEHRLNVGVDFAYAEDETSVYFRIGEAF